MDPMTTHGGRVKSPAAGGRRFRWVSDYAMTLEILTIQCRLLTNGSMAHSFVDGAGCADVGRTRA
jgi:hypothetical protein